MESSCEPPTNQHELTLAAMSRAGHSLITESHSLNPRYRNWGTGRFVSQPD